MTMIEPVSNPDEFSGQGLLDSSNVGDSQQSANVGDICRMKTHPAKSRQFAVARGCHK